MGEVYRARDTKLNREVALKVLPDAFAADSGNGRSDESRFFPGREVDRLLLEPAGHLVYIYQGKLFAAPFSWERLEVTAPPAPVVEGVISN